MHLLPLLTSNLNPSAYVLVPAVARLPLLSLFLVASALLTPKEAAAQTSTLRGVVTDAETDVPLPNVNVVARGEGVVRGASTDLEGRFALQELPAGAYRVEISSVGYVPQSRRVRLAPEEPETLDLALEAQTYDLAEITVRSAEPPQQRASASTVQTVPLASLDQEDAAVAADVMRLVPAAHVQTNSRGETLVYLRNAGERQVALFFDGALLNVPWDNRVDLSLIPATILGGITVAKGVPSVLYGTNVLGGAVNMTSRSLEQEASFTEVEGAVGLPRTGQGHVTHLGHLGRLSYAASAGYTSSTGLALPDDADLPFSQRGDDVRTNTDRDLLNLFARAGYRFGGGARLALSALHLDGEKGIAPESHLDPALERVRFWRYPTWRTTMLILHGAVPFGAASEVRGAVWGSRFAQTIHNYRSADYDRLADEEKGQDYTAGTRLVFQQPAGPGRLRLALNALVSQHEQQEMAFDESGLPGSATPEFVFRQHTYSAGAEYEADLTGRLSAVLGGSLDAMFMPETGDKPERDPFVDAGATTGLTYDLGRAWSLRAAAGRKVRFPTMRELFGEAIDRFLLNPDLRPETSFLTEAGLARQGGRLAAEVVGFFNRTYDTIDQRTVDVEGGSKRQRINLDGSRVYGVEVVGRFRPLRRWTLDGHLTWTRARGFEEDGETRRLAEKPEWLGTLTLAWNNPGGFSLALQSVYTGRAYSPGAGGALEPLPTSLVLDARASYPFLAARQSSVFSEVFLHVDNLTDEVALPQLGLPQPGRTVRAGLNVSF